MPCERLLYSFVILTLVAIENTMEDTKAIEKIKTITLDGEEPFKFFCRTFRAVSIIPHPINMTKGIAKDFKVHFSPFL